MSLLTGLIMILMGLLNLGWIVDFVSLPVMSSFATAAAIVTAGSQLKEFFGLVYDAPRFVGTIVNFFTHIREVLLADTLLGLGCLTFLLVLQYFKNFKLELGGKKCWWQTTFNGFWQVLVMGRNAIVIFVTLLMAMAMEGPTPLDNPFTLTSEIPLGLPPVIVPQFVLRDVNGTVVRDFATVIADVGVGSLILALIALMEAVAVVKSLRPEARIDSTQELIAIGSANAVGSFFGAYPITGSFSRSAVNNNSGVRTPGGGIVTGCLVILALVTLAPFFHYIPKTALASTIIASVIPLIKFNEAFAIFKSKRVDMIPYIVTLTVCLGIGLEYGIIVGVLISVCLLLKQTSQPRISVEPRMTPNGDPFVLIRPDRSILFTSYETLSDKIHATLPEMEASFECDQQTIVLDCEKICTSDSTFGQVSFCLSCNL